MTVSVAEHVPKICLAGSLRLLRGGSIALFASPRGGSHTLGNS